MWWGDQTYTAFWDHVYFFICWRAATGKSPQAIIHTPCFTPDFGACHVNLLRHRSAENRQSSLYMLLYCQQKKKVSKQNIVFSYSPSSYWIATFPLSGSFLKVQNLAVLIILHIACKHLPCFFSWMTCQYCWEGSQECKQEGSKSGL